MRPITSLAKLLSWRRVVRLCAWSCLVAEQPWVHLFSCAPTEAVELTDLTAEDLKTIHPEFESDVVAKVGPDAWGGGGGGGQCVSLSFSTLTLPGMGLRGKCGLTRRARRNSEVGGAAPNQAV